MADLENSLELAKKALDEMRSSGMLTKKTLDQLNGSLKQTNQEIKGLGDQSEETADRFKDLDKRIVATVRALTDSAQAVRDNRDDFRSLNPAIRATGVAVGVAGRKLGDTISAVGVGLSGISTFFGPKGKLVGLIGGGLLAGIGQAVGASSDAIAQLAVQFGEFSTGELQRAVDAYRELGSVGAIGAQGMTQIYEQSIQAGLSLAQYAKVVSLNSDRMATAAGTTERGAKALASMAEAGQFADRQFLALGISFEQQRDFQAKFLEQNRLVNRISLRDTMALTEASHNYIKQIDELARITGMSREEAQKSLDDLNRNIRFRASQRIAEQQYGADVRRNMQDFAAVIGSADKLMGEGIADIFSGTATEAAKAVQIATNNQAEAIAQMVKTGVINANQGAAMVQQAMKEKIAGLGGDAFLAFAGKVEGPLESYLLGMDNIATAQNLTVEAMEEARKKQTAAATAQDKNTANVVDAQKSLQNLAITLDTIVKDKLFPLAADAVKKFTGVLDQSVTFIADKLGLKVRAATGVGGGGPGGAGAPGAGGVSAAEGPRMFMGGIMGGIEDFVTGGRGFRSYSAGPPAIDWTEFIDFTGGTGSIEHFAKLEPAVQKAFVSMAQDYSNLTGKRLQINSAFRSPEEQAAVDPGTNPKAAPGMSLHNVGRALDLNSDQVQYLKSSGLLDTYGFKTLANDPPHIFMRQGGIASGPHSGYTAMLHGTEAVVPLPDGRQIPVEMNGMTDKIGQQIDTLMAQTEMMGEMVSLMRDSVTVQNKIYRATAG